MDVFHLRDETIADYGRYAHSFVSLRDERIARTVDEEVERGAFWPDPLLQLNPNFKPGAYIDELVQAQELHPECEHIFRVGKEGDHGRVIRLHQHQLDALRTAAQGHNYVLTTGTGSGKSLAYIVPIVNNVLHNPAPNQIKAIIVYPMNALANSQQGELEKFLSRGYPQGPPVTFAKYTGQESEEERQAIRANPPDILLTNYVMLELILTRTHERALIDKAQGLRFLVLDELHTYRGRQGADVALLVRRVRNRLAAQETMQCIGTSATLSTTGSIADQQAEVAAVATKIFGAPVAAEHVIRETLERATAEPDLSDPTFIASLTTAVQNALTEESPPTAYDTFLASPLSHWIESTFGVERETHFQSLVRTVPQSITGAKGAAQTLSELTNLSRDKCEKAIMRWLLASYHCDPHPTTGQPPFAFRLHQFLSPGDTIYAALDNEATRHLTLRGQRYVPHSQQQHILYPLVFCRECGQEYYSVRRHTLDKHTSHFSSRDFRDTIDEKNEESGYLYLNNKHPWPAKRAEELERLPDDWLEEGKNGLEVRRVRRDRLPVHFHVAPTGRVLSAGETGEGQMVVYVRSKFLFCLNCGVAYDPNQSDFGKLAPLSSDGRSSATTILSMSIIRQLEQAQDLPERARKLLSFTDNRQDASLQAGHFNDFILVGMLRGALYRAVSQAGTSGLIHDNLTEAVMKALDLPLSAYAKNPDAKFNVLRQTQQAFQDVLGYRLYLDLRRGWRVNSPNLEQTGLLRIDYLDVDDLSADESFWAECHPALRTAVPETRAKIMRVLLDYMRRELAIGVKYLHSETQNKIEMNNNRWLLNGDDGQPASIWALDPGERMQNASILFPRSRRRRDSRDNVFVSARGGFGLYLRRHGTLPHIEERLKLDDGDEIIRDILAVMRQAGLIDQVAEPRDDDDVPGYQLNAAIILWYAGDGATSYHDPIRTPQSAEGGGRPNPFFVDFYRTVSAKLAGLEAREHTAQVRYEDRLTREKRFRKADLPVLYCSPTMELGVDIAELNVVNMRNVPPTPANYAQRSGRAGRSGQPALVITYCSSGSPHDQYFFRRPEQMVGGQVAAPRLDLANEDLLQAHMQAIWLAESGLNLGHTLSEVLDISGSQPTLALRSDVVQALRDPHVRQRAHRRATAVLASVSDRLQQATWYHHDWLDDILNQIEATFETACDRWRELYRSASEQSRRQSEIILDASQDARRREQARALRDHAERQLRSLTEMDRLGQSDFYSYRYFATEGFLPGYSFPRLPVRAYIRGASERGYSEGSYISRSRFLAISEFGPRAIIYHEGSRHLINQVLLPVDGDGPLMEQIKLCPACGYLHPPQGDIFYNNCERCGAELTDTLDKLMHLRNVSTMRRHRISSDEEERLRFGYDIRTGVRFAVRDGRMDRHTAVVTAQNAPTTPFIQAEYGQSAEIWRINLGEARWKEETPPGFVLDLERGYWARSQQETADDHDDPLSRRQERVIPYVADHRNCLLLQPQEPLEPAIMASVQTALKRAIETVFQLEDNELAAEPLPDRQNRVAMLFFEAAEGGAGVLRQLVDDTNKLAEVAREALAICHFDPDTGDDLNHAPTSHERCEAACYDCLLSYSNQRDHDLLNRHAAQPILMALATATVQTSPTAASPAEHAQTLLNLCESELEKKWIQYLLEYNLRLPDKAQQLLEMCQTRADFVYSPATAVYIDGPAHDTAEQKAKDQTITSCLQNHGATVIRFRYDDDWAAIIERYRYLFGGD